MPMEELVVVGKLTEMFELIVRKRAIFGELLKMASRDTGGFGAFFLRILFEHLLFPDERSTPEVGDLLLLEPFVRRLGLVVFLLLALEGGDGVGGDRLDGFRSGAEGVEVGGVLSDEEAADAFALALVAGLEEGAGFGVVAGESFVGAIGDAFLDEGGRGAEQGVAAADVVVEERKWLAGFERLDPEGDLAQLDGHRVDVDSIQAAANHIAQGVLVVVRSRFVLAGADGGEGAGKTVGGGDEEVAGAYGGVADSKAQESLLGE
ncbi:MAG: hypothetical protein KDN22_29995 [Verrucomicrobiae bacterium]|nr:hypothetical protein [Verrucomicrobiae bacterium]